MSNLDLTAASTSSLELLDLELDEAKPASDQAALELRDQNSALVRLHALLSMPSVTVPSDFADSVMRSVRAEAAKKATDSAVASRSSRSSWLIAAAGLAALVLGIVAMGGSASGSGSLFGTFGAALSSVVLAGAGLLSATWRGVGSSVGSWIGVSPTTGAFVALAFLGSVVALGVTLRRARQEN